MIELQLFTLCSFLMFLKENGVILFSGTKPLIKKYGNIFGFRPSKNLEFEKLDHQLKNVIEDFWVPFLTLVRNSIGECELKAQNNYAQCQMLERQYGENVCVWNALRNKLPYVADPIEQHRIIGKLHTMEDRTIELQNLHQRLFSEVNQKKLEAERLCAIMKAADKWNLRMKNNGQPKNRMILTRF